MDHDVPAQEVGTDAGRENRMTETATRSHDPQRLRALERANKVRLARASLKRRIADGEVPAARIILDSPWEASSWSVGELLMSQRRWGSTRCQKFLRALEISETKQIGTLTPRQRNALVTNLAARDRDHKVSLVA